MSSSIFLGTRKGLIEVQKGPTGWAIARVSFPGVPVPMLLRDARSGLLHAAVEHGHFGNKFHTSADEGGTWEERACPTYPPKPDDVPDTICQMSQQPIPWALKKIWALAPGGTDQPGVLWCGTIPGGLFKSSDDGQSWQLVESLWNEPRRAKWFGGGADWPGIHSICVDPRDSDHITIGISCGGVWQTFDGGKTWANDAVGLQADFMPPDQIDDPDIQDPHLIVSCPAAPDHLWMQHHNGIFKSSDGGTQWQRLHSKEPSDFGFAVAVHPQDPETAWFVPAAYDDMRIPVDAALCVMRTRDGGQTFQACRKGLPQEHAYHLVYRHCLDVTADGHTLVFGSTTGSVWISEDAGDSWERLSAELPPIYAVRFGGG